MTARVIRAMENPYVNVIGHPTARLIGKRPPIDLDLEAVFEAAARTGTALEVNSFPDRLDLKDEHILWARRYGAKFAVNTDSHSPVHLSLMRFGVATAQRGWLTKDDVINTWPLGKAPPVPAQGATRLSDGHPSVGGSRGASTRAGRRWSRPTCSGRVLVRALGGRIAARGADRGDRGVRARRPGEPRVPGRDGAERGRCSASRATCTCTSPTACISA